MADYEKNALGNSPTSSRSVTETVTGSHHFVIQGYSLAKGMGIGKHIAGDNFTVGGYQWAIYFYPDGKNPEDNSTYVSVFIALASEVDEIFILDDFFKQTLSLLVLEHCGFALSFNSKFKAGYKRFYRRALLETSDYLKDDCLKINCTVGVVVSAVDCPRLQHSIRVPESDIGSHFGMLLDNMEDSDVVLNVAGEKFHAHKLVLAARPPVFRSEFFNQDGEKHYESDLTDMEPKWLASSSFSESDSLIAKLLVAADKYDLVRLRRMCKSHLCKDITVGRALKYSVMRSDGFEFLKETCPRLQSELLKAVAGCEDDCSSSGGGKSRSVCGQLSEGGNTSGRRVRQRTWNHGDS
ncbi:hypothetical protein E3N88_28803 [Mikania micrantha]|uniref:BTB domain-containing protein n=1 Tax=Mikania micrantha TaxID=192012 RepID=A0A5N6N3F4_9ASTR|nr:hypothetical protein E3N88_28803 [Mikania micrantha]